MPDTEDVAAEETEIQGGQIETGFSAVGMIRTNNGTCTGTLISPNHVLTAKHCAGPAMVFQTGTSSANFVTHPITQQLGHPSKDLMIATLQTPIYTIAPMVLRSALPPVGQTCTGVGFGIHNENGGMTSGIKRSCLERVESSGATTITVKQVTGVADSGDSGGPLLCDGVIAAVASNKTDGNYPNHVRVNYASNDRAWIINNSSVVPSGFGSAGILWRCMPSSGTKCGTAPAGTAAIWHDGNAGGTTMAGTVDFSWQIQGVGDFGGNRIADVLWRDTAGNNKIWPDGVGPGYSIASVGTNWSVVGLGDFDGNGRSDILWRSTGGDNAIWTDGVAPGYWLAPVDGSWRVAGVGDFDGNGRSDILWRSTGGSNVIWTDGVAPGYWLAPTDNSWAVAGVGDLDGDHRADILWRSTSGDNVLWSAGVPGVWLAPLDTSWQVAGLGDFDRDGTSDILWRRNDGLTALWLHGDVGRTVWPGPLETSWKIQGVGRFD